MMTPLDIQNKSFSSGTLGYKKAEVDSFMAEVLADYEKLYKMNAESKEKINSFLFY